ncbi:pyrroloquinoline quinone biosynthesis peptide chaperone PqqD [Cryptosporangium sp. NPDC048952]|uniref:pyrroloquinoline quinone biosynthesis peptide chaperone PqqD n=1 Tax=Cryptosporangium sp. NPDC048952 TaxID=3363961 RepID=UPI003717705C
MSRPGLARPKLARHCRLSFDNTRQRPILLLPETVVVLNKTGAAILERCDGQHTVAEIEESLAGQFTTVPDGEVERFLAGMRERRYVVSVDD